VPQSDPPLTMTTLANGVGDGDIHTSLRVSLPGRANSRTVSAVAIILYAGSPGAFVDLAADLAWLTARPPSEFVLDQHLTHDIGLPSEARVHAASAINQAIGVLVGRGYTLRQASWELDARAARAGTDRHAAAARDIIAAIEIGDEDGDFDIH
jgi:hypothetical protein